ncbi:MAG TPA: hypothetical protein VEG62_07310 [Acidimicrobiales bacterium]|nr:hypothetical protein [Acidimicrobiales bacterium]
MRTTAPGHTEVTPLVSVADPRGRSRLGAVIALAGAGLLMQGVADSLSRNGDSSTALRLFVVGMALLFGACAWRLTGAPARRNERLLVSLVLGLGLLASYVMRYPLLLTSYDELQQRATLSHLLSSRALFPTNTLLPVSPYYPGLELATAAARWLTGLPLAVDQVIVLTSVRVLLVLGVFLLVERACGSARAGGVGALVYMANPQFYGFDSEYAYETIALALGVAAVYLLFTSVDRARPGIGRLFLLALCTVAAVVVTHHLTGWLTVGFVVVWAIGLAFSARFRKGTPTLRARWRAQARVIGIAAAISVVLGATWTQFVGSRITAYLGPIFSAAYSDIVSALGNLHGNRQVFESASGSVTPTWDIVLILGSAVAWCLILLPSLYGVAFKRSIRGGPLRFMPAVIAATYPILLLANISTTSKAVAGRATAFTFFGVALVVGAWVARRIAHRPRWPERVATIAVAILCAVGSLLFGIGPIVSVLPGPYQVGADELSLGSPSLAVAHWADMNIPAGTHVAADRDNGDLLNAIAGVDPVTAEAGLVDPVLLYFDHRLTPYDISTIRRGDIRYVFVDDRLTQGLPLYGVYVADGEPQTRLTLEQLNKFDSYPGIRRVYDNGPIKVYDVSALLPPSERAAPTNPPDGGVGSGLQVGILLLALLVVALWVVRLRRDKGRRRGLAHLVVVALTAVLVLAIFGAFVVRLTHVRPDAAAAAVLLVLGALSFWRPAPKARPAMAPKQTRRSRTQVLLALAGAALLLVGVGVATMASLKQWTPPPELAVTGVSGGHPVAQVQLGSAGPVPAQLWLSHNGHLLRVSDLARTTAVQDVPLPAIAGTQGSRVALLVNGKALRLVGN